MGMWTQPWSVVLGLWSKVNHLNNRATLVPQVQLAPLKKLISIVIETYWSKTRLPFWSIWVAPFIGVHVAKYFICCVVCYPSLFVLVSFDHFLCCPFFELRLLIIHLVSSLISSLVRDQKRLNTSNVSFGPSTNS